MLVSLHDSVDGRLESSVTRSTDQTGDIITVLKTENIILPGLQVRDADFARDLGGVVGRWK